MVALIVVAALMVAGAAGIACSQGHQGWAIALLLLGAAAMVIEGED